MSDAGAWESVVSVPDLTASGARVRLIADDGSADLYGDGTEAKGLSHPEWQKSRTTWFTRTDPERLPGLVPERASARDQPLVA
ncbi:hypothetical protein ACWEN3_15825 [Streptomyces sp. NPDC004561]